MASLSPKQMLTLDSSRLRHMFDAKSLTIAKLVSKTVQQIQSHNKHGLKLNAIISMPPKAQLLARAKQLDEELQAGKSCGPLHGIPIVVKDSFATSPGLGMTTSAGNFALLEAQVTENAPIVKRLLDCGAIIIGKSNLSEFCGFKGKDLLAGFSPVGGQTVSPYVYGDIDLGDGDLSPTRPGGSSTGSAVSVSSGFSVIGIGTENDGSVVQPASRQALFALKPSRELLSTEGTWALSKSLDVPGVMARSVHDVAAAVESLVDPSKLPEGGYSTSLNGSFKGLRLGFADPTMWRFPPNLWTPSDGAKQQHDSAYHDAVNLTKELGAIVSYPVKLPRLSELSTGGGYAPYVVNLFEHEETIREFFRDYFDPSSEIHDLASVVDFIKQHPEQCLPKEAPDQSWLIRAIEERPSEKIYNDAVQHMLKFGGDEGFRKTFTEHQLDIIVAPMDSPVCSLSTASGYPLANVPLGRYNFDGKPSRPFGLAAFARPNCETSLLQFMSACEAEFPSRPIPEQLVKEADGRVV